MSFKKTKTERLELKKEKSVHNRELRLNPENFEALRVDMASTILKTASENPPKWGGFILKLKMKNQPVTIIKFK